MFSSILVTPGKSFESVLSGSPRQPQQLQPETVERASFSQRTEQHTQQTGQSRSPTVNSSFLDNMLNVATVVQQIMTEVNGAMYEEDNIVAITKLCLA
jgi:hypothetical protein